MIFGASGMVGQGVLRECLLDPDVTSVLSVGRSPSGLMGRRVNGLTGSKLKDIVVPNVFDLSAVRGQLQGYDACFFCLGTTAVGKSEEEYTRLTFDLTMSVAETLLPLNPGMTFVYVSGASTDSTEKGKQMWARVKGRTENALMRLGFKGAYMFRPGIIQPLDGIRPKGSMYRFVYSVLNPLTPLLVRIFPNAITNTRNVGRAMISVARRGYERPILEIADIERAAVSG
jgi:uncharacterized protein YbjT (DUF2867 family)